MTLGPYTVIIALRRDNPAFPCYLIFRGERLVGKQFSMPDESDCRYREMQKQEASRQARESAKVKRSWNTGIFGRRRGRPKKQADPFDIPVLTELTAT